MANSRWYADVPDLVVMLADVMVPGLPIHRCTFFAGGVIRPAPPTNLLQMDRLVFLFLRPRHIQPLQPLVQRLLVDSFFVNR
jgi:hypothetical protein